MDFSEIKHGVFPLTKNVDWTVEFLHRENNFFNFEND
jgi:hypothetical protein